jgi:hypothetical protein
LNSRKLLVVAMLAVACTALTGIGTVATASAKPAKTKLTIDAWPEGLFGYVTSPKAEQCAAQRQVVIFEQQGPGRNPAKDKRIASARTGAEENSFQWSTQTARTGRFYAEAEKKPGCRAALSGTVRSLSVGGESGAEPGAAKGAYYPPCSPYVSEGTIPVCRFDELHLDLDQEGPFNPCRFGSPNGNCAGVADRGPFPWGTSAFGARTKVQIFWTCCRRNLTVVAYQPEGGSIGVAHLGGVIPSSSSSRFTIDDGFAQNDTGYPRGDHFYTPDLPGQAAGEPGGPLYLNFVNGSGTNLGADAYISGYLYLKR